MAAVGGIWAPAALRLLRIAATKTTKVLRSRISGVTRPVQTELQHVTVKTTPTGRQPIHPVAFLRQQRRGARWNSTITRDPLGAAQRRHMSGGSTGPRVNRTQFASTNVWRYGVARITGQTPFATTLRPNLTGGALPRTAGGYSIGGGARYFSHTPAASAQVIQNVSASFRAFCLSGQRARYNGLDERGRPTYRSVSVLEEKAFRKMTAVPRASPGSFIDFQLNPTITALSPLAAAFPFAAAGPTAQGSSIPAATLLDDGVLEELAIDFGRALKELSTICADLKRLSVLGDLPIILEKPNLLRIRFPGVDAETVERLCDDIGVQRGTVGEDPEFDISIGVPIALQFPFAPEAGAEKTITSPGGSLRSLDGEDIEQAFMEMEDNPWLSDPEGYESMSTPHPSEEYRSEDFEGLEGIYRFLEECDNARGHF